MDGRIDDQDGDVLNPFFTVTPPHSPPPPPSSSPYSQHQNFAFSPPDHLFLPNDAVRLDPPHHRPLNLVDDDTFVTSFASQNYQTAPRVFDRFDSSSSSGEDDEFYLSDADSIQKRLDYMMDYLDRKLSAADVSSSRAIQSQSQSLPEFIAGGGCAGIFKLPVRSAVNPVAPVEGEASWEVFEEYCVCGRWEANVGRVGVRASGLGFG